MSKNNYKLIIWDFDGVIADSEKLWVESHRKFFNEQFKTNWSFEDINKMFGGTGDATKRKILDEMGYKTTDKFWQDILDYDMNYMQEHGLEIMPDVLEILSDKRFKHCIATGGILEKTLIKMKTIGIEKYIPLSDVFTIDMVEQGKPAPDLFLLAAGMMCEDPENCLVIEDSIPGMTAAKNAEMDVIAFLGSEMYQNEEYEKRVRDLGIKNIFYTMKEVQKFLS